MLVSGKLMRMLSAHVHPAALYTPRQNFASDQP